MATTDLARQSPPLPGPAGLSRKCFDARRPLHRGHDARFTGIDIRREGLGKAFAIDPKRAAIVWANLRSARWRWSLLSQTFKALAFVQAESRDVHECVYIRNAICCACNDRAATVSSVVFHSLPARTARQRGYRASVLANCSRLTTTHSHTPICRIRSR